MSIHYYIPHKKLSIIFILTLITTYAYTAELKVNEQGQTVVPRRKFTHIFSHTRQEVTTNGENTVLRFLQSMNAQKKRPGTPHCLVILAILDTLHERRRAAPITLTFP